MFGIGVHEHMFGIGVHVHVMHQSTCYVASVKTFCGFCGCTHARTHARAICEDLSAGNELHRRHAPESHLNDPFNRYESPDQRPRVPNHGAARTLVGSVALFPERPPAHGTRSRDGLMR